MSEAGWTHVANVKAEGWYWWRRSVGYHKALKVYSVAGSLCVAQGDDHVPIEEIDGGEWLGPITPDSYQQGRVASCEWTYDEMDDYYETACKNAYCNAYCLADGTLKDNDHKYCPYCGGLIQLAQQAQEEK